MLNMTDEEMTKLRQNVAINLCISHPKVFDAVMSKKPSYVYPNELSYYVIVQSLMLVEPSIRHILRYYYKRERHS